MVGSEAAILRSAPSRRNLLTFHPLLLASRFSQSRSARYQTSWEHLKYVFDALHTFTSWEFSLKTHTRQPPSFTTGKLASESLPAASLVAQPAVIRVLIAPPTA